MELLSLGWEFFSGNINVLGTLTVAFLVSSQFLSALVSYLTPANADGASNTGHIILSLVAILVSMGLSYMGTISVVLFLNEKISGKSLSFGEAVSKSLPLFVPLVLTFLLLFVFMVPLFILLIIPGLIYSLYWCFSLQALVIREKKYTQALAYSKSVVQGRWWNVFGCYFAFGLIVGLPATIVSGIFTGLFQSVPLVSYIFSSLIFGFFSVFMTCVSTLFFLNLEANPLQGHSASAGTVHPETLENYKI